MSSLADVFTMKVKVISDRGVLCDYFDLKRIEEITGRGVEEGMGLYMTATTCRQSTRASDTSSKHSPISTT